jgi:hypothetical protein
MGIIKLYDARTVPQSTENEGPKYLLLVSCYNKKSAQPFPIHKLIFDGHFIRLLTSISTLRGCERGPNLIQSFLD